MEKSRNAYDERKAKNKFFEVLRELVDTTQKKKELAEFLGVSTETVASYLRGATFPPPQTLYEIAQYYDCSLDHLIGLSDVRKPDASLQGACEYTGLSEKAITNLADMSRKDNGWYRGSLRAVLESSSFQKLIEIFSDSIEASCDTVSNILFLEGFMEHPNIGKLAVETQKEKLQDLYYSLDRSIRELYGMKYAISEAAVALYGEIQDLDGLERDLRRIKETFDLGKALTLLQEGTGVNEKENLNGIDEA